MYEQRAAKPNEQFEPRPDLWRPTSSMLEPEEGDAYVVVDERMEGMLTLTVDPWPRVDVGGRLHFESETTAVAAAESVAHTVISASRQEHGQDAPERPIRIGDVFLARPMEAVLALARDRVTDPVLWRERVDLVDVTRDAREAAKIAFYGAVAPLAAPGELQETSDDAEALQPPSVSTAFIARPEV